MFNPNFSQIKQEMEQLIGWIQPILFQHPVTAPLVFITAHTLMAVFFLPCSPMTLMAGALWGGAYGLVISMIAAIVSSMTTFLLARGFLHDRIKKFLMQRYPKVAKLLAQAANHDWKIIAVSQLNPLVPSSALGYIFGLSSIALIRYLLFSVIFMIPLQFLFVITGHSVTSFLMADGRWGVPLALIVLVAVVPFVSKRIFRNFYN